MYKSKVYTLNKCPKIQDRLIIRTGMRVEMDVKIIVSFPLGQKNCQYTGGVKLCHTLKCARYFT